MSEIKCQDAHLDTTGNRREELLYIVPRAVSLSDLLDPSHWSKVTRKLSRPGYPWTKIECIADDGSWEAVLRVVSVSDGMAKVRVLFQWGDVERIGVPKPVRLPAGAEVEHIAGQGWRAMFNKQIVVERQGDEKDAIAAVMAHAERAKAQPAPQPVAQPDPHAPGPRAAPVSYPPSFAEVASHSVSDEVTGHPARKAKAGAAS